MVAERYLSLVRRLYEKKTLPQELNAFPLLRTATPLRPLRRCPPALALPAPVSPLLLPFLPRTPGGRGHFCPLRARRAKYKKLKQPSRPRATVGKHPYCHATSSAHASGSEVANPVGGAKIRCDGARAFSRLHKPLMCGTALAALLSTLCSYASSLCGAPKPLLDDAPNSQARCPRGVCRCCVVP